MSLQGQVHIGRNGRREFLQTGEETNGRLVEMRVTYPPRTSFPFAHLHPYQTETFSVEAGELVVRIDGEESLNRSGDTFVVPPGAVHQMRNASDDESTVNWRVEPALRTAEFFAVSHLVESAGLLEHALLVSTYRDEFRLAGSPLMRAGVVLVATLARLAGRSLPSPGGEGSGR